MKSLPLPVSLLLLAGVSVVRAQSSTTLLGHHGFVINRNADIVPCHEMALQ